MLSLTTFPFIVNMNADWWAHYRDTYRRPQHSTVAVCRLCDFNLHVGEDVTFPRLYFNQWWTEMSLHYLCGQLDICRRFWKQNGWKSRKHLLYNDRILLYDFHFFLQINPKMLTKVTIYIPWFCYRWML